MKEDDKLFFSHPNWISINTITGSDLIVVWKKKKPNYFEDIFNLYWFARIRLVFRDFLFGLHYHIPVCCIFNYLIDRILNINSGLGRGSIKGYIPCWIHKKYHEKM